MAKPTELGEWATNPGQTLEPSAPQKAAGFIEGDKPPARWINWLWNVAHQWHAYTSNLHGEAEFLNKNYPWTGEHSFSEPIQGDLKLTGEVLYDEARTRRMILPLSAFRPSVVHEDRVDGITAWQYSDTDTPLSGMWASGSGNDVLVGYFRLPKSATAVTLNYWLSLEAGATVLPSAARLRFAEAENAAIQELASSPSIVSGPLDAASGQVLSADYPFDPETDLLRVRFKTGNTAAACRIKWVELWYNELGPHY